MLVDLTEAELTSRDEFAVYFRYHDTRKVDRSQLSREAIRYYRETLFGPSAIAGRDRRETLRPAR